MPLNCRGAYLPKPVRKGHKSQKTLTKPNQYLETEKKKIDVSIDKAKELFSCAPQDLVLG